MATFKFTVETSRLSLGRRRRGMTQTELAAKCDVSPQYISMIERGQYTPSHDVIEKIADAVDFPVGFFYASSIPQIEPEAVSFRALRSMKSSTRDVGLGVLELAAEVIQPDLESRFKLPPVNVPDYQDKKPEEAADFLRMEWGLGYEPIQNVVHLLESKGVSVFWTNHPSPALDAISYWKEDKPFVILNTHKYAGERGRFDAAHELGHLVLHRQEESLNIKRVEDEANDFASAFLMPLETFGHECPTHPDFQVLYHLKPRWKVSISAMIMQGAKLGKFSEWQKRQAFKQLNALGMRTNEKQRIPREQSRLHAKVFEALDSKGIAAEAYAEILNLSYHELEELMPVAKEFRAVPPRTQSEPQEYMRRHLRVIRGGKA